MMKHVEVVKEEIKEGQRRVTQVVTTPSYPRKFILSPRFDDPAGADCLKHFRDWSREELIAHLLNGERLLEQTKAAHSRLAESQNEARKMDAAIHEAVRERLQRDLDAAHGKTAMRDARIKQLEATIVKLAMLVADPPPA